MREDKEEYPCQVVEMSAGGMALLSPVQCREGERIVAYLDNFGRLEGIVVRCVDGGFAVRIIASQYKREKIANLLTWLINRESLGLNEERKHERVVPRNPSSKLILPDGDVFDCRVIDVSLSGASIAIEKKPLLPKSSSANAWACRAPSRYWRGRSVRRDAGPGQHRPLFRLGFTSRFTPKIPQFHPRFGV